MKKKPSAKLTQGPINFLRGLIASGMSQNRLGYLSDGRDASFTAAAVHALLRRLNPASNGCPHHEAFAPVLLGWKLEGSKDEVNMTAPRYTNSNGIPWAPRLDLFQPKSASASCSVAQIVGEYCVGSFHKAVLELSQFRLDMTKLAKEPQKPGEDMFFSLFHAEKIIHDLCLDVEMAKLHFSGLMTFDSFRPGQSLFVPIRFTEFNPSPGSREPGKPNTLGVLEVRRNRAKPWNEKSDNALNTTYIPSNSLQNHTIPLGSVICINNLVWEKDPH